MNYLEHKTKVKYGDGLLAHSQEWQWLIRVIPLLAWIKQVCVKRQIFTILCRKKLKLKEIDAICTVDQHSKESNDNVW